jgi:hypothetical protein
MEALCPRMIGPSCHPTRSANRANEEEGKLRTMVAKSELPSACDILVGGWCWEEREATVEASKKREKEGGGRKKRENRREVYRETHAPATLADRLSFVHVEVVGGLELKEQNEEPPTKEGEEVVRPVCCFDVWTMRGRVLQRVEYSQRVKTRRERESDRPLDVVKSRTETLSSSLFCFRTPTQTPVHSIQYVYIPPQLPQHLHRSPR